MMFKIDTKSNHWYVKVDSGDTSDNMAALLSQLCKEKLKEAPYNLIIDFQRHDPFDKGNLETFTSIHKDAVEMDKTIVFTGLPEDALANLQKEDEDSQLNIAPTLQEAVDIVSMDDLLRDVLEEEE